MHVDHQLVLRQNISSSAIITIDKNELVEVVHKFTYLQSTFTNNFYLDTEIDQRSG